MGDDGRVRRSLTPGGKEGEVMEERGLPRKQSSVPAADGSATGAGRQQLTVSQPGANHRARDVGGSGTQDACVIRP